MVFETKMDFTFQAYALEPNKSGLTLLFNFYY